MKMEKPCIQREEYFELFAEPEKPYDLSERFFNFAVDVIHDVRTLPNSKEYNVVIYQLVKASTSVGANYEEAQAAVSKADFTNKIGICLKEARESYYWLRIIVATLDQNQHWKPLAREGGEIRKILGAIFTQVSKKR